MEILFATSKRPMTLFQDCTCTPAASHKIKVILQTFQISFPVISFSIEINGKVNQPFEICVFNKESWKESIISIEIGHPDRVATKSNPSFQVEPRLKNLLLWFVSTNFTALTKIFCNWIYNSEGARSQKTKKIALH